MNADFAKVARLLASPARSTMVGVLLDGRARTAGELARLSGVAPSTASEHLDELAKGGLLTMSAQGRHRYFDLAGPDVAEALEAFARICPSTPVRSLRASSEAEALRLARTCYDHLAGRLGVALLDAFVARHWLVATELALTLGSRGTDGFAQLNVDTAALATRRRRFARPCLDWTERRPHLAGALGAALSTSMLELGWVEPQPRQRAVRITPLGERRLRDVLGVEIGPGERP